jgi:hypothetical protein
VHHSIGCPTRYQTGHFFNNFINNEDIATKFEAGLPHCVRNVKEKNVLLFKFSCNIFIGVRIIKEMPGSVASGTLCIIHKENPTTYKSVSKSFISYLYEAQHVSGDTPPIIRTCSCWKLSGTLPDSVQQLHVQQPSTYAKPEAASAVLGS